ncbi:MAG: hypothetical protein AAFN93_24425, partial [Bacteroidota bacterium]
SVAVWAKLPKILFCRAVNRLSNFFRKKVPKTQLWMICIISIVLSSCLELDNEEIEGLWALEELWISGKMEQAPDYYLKVQANGIFAVARSSGDIQGIYSLDHDVISLESPDKQWFSRDWQLLKYQNKLVLEGKGDYTHEINSWGNSLGVLHTKLIFIKTDIVPSYKSPKYL